jgi:hypothetical protein
VSGRLHASAALSPVKNAGVCLIGGWVEYEHHELGKVLEMKFEGISAVQVVQGHFTDLQERSVL